MENIKKFAHFLKQSERSKATIKNYLVDLNAFGTWFKDTNNETCALKNITPTDLREYKQFLIHQKSLKPNSINRKIATLRSYLEWAKQTQQIKHHITVPKFLPKTKFGPRWLNKLKQNQLLRLVEQKGNVRDITIIRLLLNTGLRVQELCALYWKDITISDRKGTLIVHHGKGEKRREVTLNKDARDALSSIGYLKHVGQNKLIFQGQRGALTPRGVQFLLQYYSSTMKEKITPHSLHHTFCKNLINAGIGLEKVALMAGHENLETTRRYCEPSMLDIQQAVDLIGEKE